MRATIRRLRFLLFLYMAACLLPPVYLFARGRLTPPVFIFVVVGVFVIGWVGGIRYLMRARGKAGSDPAAVDAATQRQVLRGSVTASWLGMIGPPLVLAYACWTDPEAIIIKLVWAGITILLFVYFLRTLRRTQAKLKQTEEAP